MDEHALQPPPGNAFVAAFDWLLALTLGTTATVVAVLTVAGLGLLMLTGRIDLRRSGSVVAGCFILFGARIIAAGLLSLVSYPATPSPVPTTTPMMRFTPAPAPSSPPAAAYDPYAGAAVPQ